MYYIIALSDNLITNDTTLLKFDIYVYIAPFNHPQFLTGRKDIGICKFLVLLINHIKYLPK